MSESSEAPRIIIKKVKSKHAAHHGGAWKVAYADFVTAMMALFMVLWLLTQADVKLRSQIAQYFRDPGVLPGGSLLSQESNSAQTREPSVAEKDVVLIHSNKVRKKQERQDESSVAEQKELEKKASAIEKAIERAAVGDQALQALRDQVIVQVTPAGLTIEVVDKRDGASMLFDVSSSELKAPLVALLGRIAKVLGEMPNEVLVGGHTDSRPYPAGSAKTNWQLSFERADAARRVLEANGVRSGQVTRILAYADSNPLVPEDPLADENRRLSIVAAREEPAPGSGRPQAELPVALAPDPAPMRPTALRIGG